MGIISHQASRNAVSILLGTVTGAVNTIIILPKAFDGFEEGWGLIKVLTAYAMIFSQFIHGGIPNAIIRYFPKIKAAEQGVFLQRLFIIPIAGALIFLLLLALNGTDVLRLVNPDDADMLRARLPELFVMTVMLTLFFALNGYLSAILKTTVFQFLNESFLKTWYLAVAAAYLLNLIDFDLLLLLYVGGYVIATVILLVHSVQSGFTLQSKKINFPIPTKEIAGYSIYSILDRGASIVVTNLDIIMIGIIAGLEDVAFYTLAFYIGSVTMMPQKSILTIANPVASAAIAAQNQKDLKSIYHKSSLMQTILGGIIFVAIWVSIDEVMLLLPDKFSGGKWVVFYIGISKLIQMATGVSGGILVYSKYFRMNFYLNVMLIALTIATNYWFIHPERLDMGITGAALATAIAFAIHNLFKVVVIAKGFNLLPFTRDFGWVIALIGAASMVYFWHPLSAFPFFSIVLKSGLVTGGLLLVFRLLGLIPHPREMLRSR